MVAQEQIIAHNITAGIFTVVFILFLIGAYLREEEKNKRQTTKK